MKTLSILFLALFSWGIALPQGCLPEGITFSTQAQIDSFQINYPGCTEIEGNVEITGNDITNLNGLSVITVVTGNLLIGPSWFGGNPELLNLNGLEGLTSVGGGLSIGNNDRLKDLNELNSLSSIGGGLEIGGFTWSGNPAGNDSLETLSGLHNLTFLGGSLNVEYNPMLINLDGLEGLTAIENSVLLMGNGLTSLSGLDQVTRIGYDLELFENNLLPDLSGLGNLDTIGGSLVIGPCGLGGPWGPPGENSSFSSLNGLQNLSAIGGNLHIGGHAIESLEALSNLKSVGYLGGSYNGWIYVCQTDSLTSLSGLDNIDSETIDHLEITDNISLTECNVESVCEYLASPNASVGINNNSDGCKNPGEVEAACLVDVPEVVSRQSSVVSYPNPTNGITEFQFSNFEFQHGSLKIYDVNGREVAVVLDEKLPTGEHTVSFDASGLPAGIYFYRLTTDDYRLTTTGKLVKY